MVVLGGLLRGVTDNCGVDDLTCVSVDNRDNFTHWLRLLSGWCD